MDEEKKGKKEKQRRMKRNRSFSHTQILKTNKINSLLEGSFEYEWRCMAGRCGKCEWNDGNHIKGAQMYF